MTRYRTKPTVIEAVQWTGDNWEAVEKFAGECVRRSSPGGNPITDVYDYLHTAWIPFGVGDWIIQGRKSEYYPCRDDVFQAKYEPEAVKA